MKIEIDKFCMVFLVILLLGMCYIVWSQKPISVSEYGGALIVQDIPKELQGMLPKEVKKVR